MRFAVTLIILPLILLCCAPPKEEIPDETNIPYPADDDLMIYQADVDSGYMPFWTDIKSVASSYMGNSKYSKYEFNSDNISIRGEGLFIGTVEVETQDFIAVIRLERPYKSRGRNSIWQVISVEEKPWPKKRSQSTE